MLKPQLDEKFQVLNHGDCWNNNMLFKKDLETGKVNDHVFVDLQVFLILPMTESHFTCTYVYVAFPYRLQGWGLLAWI